MGEERARWEAIALIRLHIVVEGQTEEGFVNEVLAPELGARNIFIDAHRITTGRKHGRAFRGGWDSYSKLVRDLTLWMKQDRNAESRFTTMVDLYRLPRDFPGYFECLAVPSAQERVTRLEGYFLRDVIDRLGGSIAARQFIPYIQLHEFEARLFSDPLKFLIAFPEQGAEVEQLHEIRNAYQCPEDINDGDETAPSKRILKVLPEYVKAVSGLVIVKQIGLPRLRQECPHFDRWIVNILHLVS